jgi:hypothetical protein
VPKLKIPKSMGACADLLFDMKQERLALDKVVEAMKANENSLTNHIIDNLPKGDTGAAGKHHKVQIRTEQIPQAEDWEAIYKHIKKTGDFDLLQRRLNPKAVMERLEDRKKVPGTKLFTAVKVSLTQVK